MASISPAPYRAIPKFGEAAHTTPLAHKKPEQHESAFMIEVDLKGKDAVTANAKKTLVQPLVNDTHAAIAKIPGMAISAISAALIGLGISKFMAKHTPSAQTLENQLSEIKLKKRAESMGAKKGELAVLPTILAITAGGKVVEEAAKTLFSLPTEAYKGWIGTKFPKKP